MHSHYARTFYMYTLRTYLKALKWNILFDLTNYHTTYIDCQQLSEVIEPKHIVELEDVLVYLLEAYNDTSSTIEATTSNNISQSESKTIKKSLQLSGKHTPSSDDIKFWNC